MESSRPSLFTRALAILVLAVAGWILLKLVLHVLFAVATFIVVIAAIIAIVWAVRVL